MRGDPTSLGALRELADCMVEMGSPTKPSKRGRPTPRRRHVLILGMMGAGKTTIADLLAAHLGRPHRDSDRDIETLTGRTGRQIAAEDGVDELHRLEEEVLLGALGSTQPNVVSGAGWVVESPRCRVTIQREAVSVWLRLSAEDLRARMDEGVHRRDISTDELAQVFARREPLLLELADVIVDARRSPSDIVTELVSSLDP